MSKPLPAKTPIPQPPLRGEQVTPLHVAAAAGSKECTQLLLDAGALTTIKDGFGGAAAMSAAVAGHGEVCKMIEDRGGIW